MIDLDKELELRVMAMTSVYNAMLLNNNKVEPSHGWSDLINCATKAGNAIVDESIKETLRVEE